MRSLGMVWNSRTALLPALLLALAGLGCSSGNPDEGLALTPAQPVVRVGEPLPITAQALEELGSEPEWEVQELHGGGFTHSRGFTITYIAPPAAGTYHLVARATRTDGSRLKQVVEVRVMADPRVEPATASLAPGASRAFAARMKGLPRNTVTWSVEEADGGTITADGQYTAPGHGGTYHVTATSTQDATVSASATVRVE
jgi:hypothetical protein